MQNKKGRTDSIIAFAIIGLIVFMAFSANKDKGVSQQATSNSGTAGATVSAPVTDTTNTIKIVGAPCTQATTLTSSTVRRYTEVAQTGQNVTILQNGVLKGTIAHASTTTVQSGPNGDTLELFPGLQSTTFYPRHLKGTITTCTGSATTGDAGYFKEVDDLTPGGAKIVYSDTSGIFSASPNKLVQIETAPSITIVNDGQANQNTGRDGFNLSIGTGGSGSVTVKLSPSSNGGWGVNGNVLNCQFPSAVYDAANPITVTVPGAGVLPEADVKLSSIQYVLIASNNTLKSYKFPGLDSRKTGDLSFSMKFQAATLNDPAGALDRINCSLADVSYYQKQNTGSYVLDIENRDTNVDLGGANTVYDWEIGVS